MPAQIPTASTTMTGTETATTPTTSSSSTSNLPFPSSFPLPPQQPSPTTLHALTIISSSKIHSKVTHILSLLYPQQAPSTHTSEEEEEATTTTTTTTTEEEQQHETSPPKQRQRPLVAITAKPSVANKLISVVEIIKRDVRGSQSPIRRSLFQYTAIKGVVEKTAKPEGAEKQKKVEGGGKKRVRGGDGKDGGAKRAKVTGDGDGGDAEEDKAGSGAESEDAFSTQTTPVFQLDKPERDAPYLTIYLSPVSVRELREAYGEQSVFSRP